MIDDLLDAVDRRRLVDGCAAIVDVPAPTGYERDCTHRVAQLLHDRNLAAHVVEHDDRSASVWARVPSSAAPGRRTVLLYSPLDTVTTGDPAQDLPMAADAMVDHLEPKAMISNDGELVSGLGAHNPKGHAACVLETAAVLASGIEGADCDVIVGFGAGGMPTFAIDGDDRTDTGHGVGVGLLLDAIADAGVKIDACVEAKSGWFVQHEEVGLAWVDIAVSGTHTYVGARHRIPYRNANADAARITLALEEHFAKPVERNSETLEPQAMVASIAGGWNRTAAFLPASARLRVDQRLLPDETGADALAIVDGVLNHMRADDPELCAESELVVEILGSFTEFDHWICEAGRRAWQAIEGRPHVTPDRLSGSTDANIIRHRGIPTMRIGLPKVHVDGQELGFAEGMNTVDANALNALTELLLRVVCDTDPSIGAGQA